MSLEARVRRDLKLESDHSQVFWAQPIDNARHSESRMSGANKRSENVAGSWAVSSASQSVTPGRNNPRPGFWVKLLDGSREERKLGASNHTSPSGRLITADASCSAS